MLRAVALAALVLALVAVCGVFISGSGRAGGRSSVALFELGEESKDDLRKALALEVSKKRFNKAQKKLAGLHLAMQEDFKKLKKWAVEKAEARAQLEKVIAENDPSMSIDRSSTAEYSASRAASPSSLAHLSTSRHAKVARAMRSSAHAPTAFEKSMAQNVALSREDHQDDAGAKKFKGELREMIKEQATTQSEVSDLASQMKSMMATQALLNKEMTHAVSQMAAKDEHSKQAPVGSSRPMPALVHDLAVAPTDADTQSFQTSESSSIHQILQRELARLNLDKPAPAQAAVATAVDDGRAHAKARLRAKSARLGISGSGNAPSARREMEAAILASKKLGDAL